MCDLGYLCCWGQEAQVDHVRGGLCPARSNHVAAVLVLEPSPDVAPPGGPEKRHLSAG